jgi:hypothetical protein
LAVLADPSLPKPKDIETRTGAVIELIGLANVVVDVDNKSDSVKAAGVVGHPPEEETVSIAHRGMPWHASVSTESANIPAIDEPPHVEHAGASVSQILNARMEADYASCLHESTSA